MHPILILLLLIVALLAISYVRRNPGILNHPAVRAVLIGALTLGLFYLSTRSHWSVLFFGLAPWLPRLWGMLGRLRATRPTPGSSSKIATEWLRMEIDHDTGEISGEVLQGEYKGRTLDSLARDELSTLLTQCRREDAESARLLEAWLDRKFGGEWEGARAREDAGAGGQQSPPADAGQMTRAQALDILGLEANATREDIIGAHRRLIQKLHPDRQGSGYLAAQVNRAKDVLLD